MECAILKSLDQPFSHSKKKPAIPKQEKTHSLAQKSSAFVEQLRKELNQPKAESLWSKLSKAEQDRVNLSVDVFKKQMIEKQPILETHQRTLQNFYNKHIGKVEKEHDRILYTKKNLN